MQILTLPFRNKKGQFSSFPLGTLIQKIDKKSHSMQEVYFVVIACNKGFLACLPYTSDITSLHQSNFKFSKSDGIKIVKVLSEKELTEWASDIQIEINKGLHPAYNGVGVNAKFLIEKILLK